MERYEMLIHMICRYGVSVQQDDWLEELRRIIEHRGKQIEDLVSRIDKLTKERDAAICDLKRVRKGVECPICMHIGNKKYCQYCSPNNSNFEWRGIDG